MRFLLPFALLLLVLSGFSSIAAAQVPYLQVYFDEELTETSADCPEGVIGTVQDTLWVVAHNFNAYIIAIEFMINYPPQITFDRDINVNGALMLGQTFNGIAMAFPTPLNAYGPVVVMAVGVVWMCNTCSGQELTLICFDVFPGSGYARAVTWPDYEVLYATAGAAVICPMCAGGPCAGAAGGCPDLPGVPVAQSTWGAVKALYR